METIDRNCLIDGYRIAYGIHGSGEPVVLIHGTPSHSYIWRKVYPSLLERGFQVQLFDLLGFGRSERPVDPLVETSVAAQAQLLPKLLDSWGTDRAHLVAHDIGGAVAMRFTLAHPARVRSLTLVDTVSYDSWPSPTWRKIIDRGLEELITAGDDAHRAMLARQLRMTVYDKSIMEGEILDTYLQPISGPLGQPSFFQHQVRHYDSKYTEEIEGELGELGKVGVRLIWGEQDEWQPIRYARRLAKDIPGAELHTIEKTGHFAMEDSPDEVARLILEHLDKGSEGSK
jgi:pimeloyl-ACP methyl ester carboxylesterase